jgi:hypothetical protein
MACLIKIESTPKRPAVLVWTFFS